MLLHEPLGRAATTMIRRVSNRYVCIHGHFYQPPRENPFTGAIPREEGAEPFANFNEKINAECYQPNARLGNFRRISFDIGPTLTSWLAEHDRQTLKGITLADAWAVRHHGSGPAMAQGYHHTILPLDSARDRRTQVRWGIRDFQYWFGRTPLGMWLPETAVDLPTLDVLAREGITYTVLAPWQAAEPVEAGRPYTVHLPSGRTINVFFYDADLSGMISFVPEVTTNAPRFAQEHLLPRFSGDGEQPHLLLIASDGELYGHHQPFRDLFLSDLLLHRLQPAGIQPITLEGYLRLTPERPPVRLREETSWSCHHGIERWRGNCDCANGIGEWKSGLRAALDSLRDQIDGITEEACAGLVRDVWEARNDYIDVVLGTAGASGWLARHATRDLTRRQRQRVLTLMEAQRYRLAMYASCAFFWDELARIEPRNAVANALQALRLVENVTDARLEFDFRNRLHPIRSPRTHQTAAGLAEAATAD
jgi:alpha-amylase/alpha-mannosidase (GH57 family)